MKLKKYFKYIICMSSAKNSNDWGKTNLAAITYHPQVQRERPATKALEKAAGLNNNNI